MNILDDIRSREIKGSHEQRSEGWFRARIGKITGSKLKDLIPSRGSFTKVGEKYLAEKVSELISGQVESIPDNIYMQWGRDTEPMAIEVASNITGSPIHQFGSIVMPWSDRVAISPDGIGVTNGEVWPIEVKCPKSSTHLSYMADGILPDDYKYQMHAEIMVADAEYGYFMSFDPRLPKEYQVFWLKVWRDEKINTIIKEWCLSGLEAIDKRITRVNNNAYNIF